MTTSLTTPQLLGLRPSGGGGEAKAADPLGGLSKALKYTPKDPDVCLARVGDIHST